MGFFQLTKFVHTCLQSTRATCTWQIVLHNIANMVSDCALCHGITKWKPERQYYFGKYVNQILGIGSAVLVLEFLSTDQFFN